jgi:uncharacterized protein YdcH (DUF465 family)
MDALAEARDRLLKEDPNYQRLARKHEGYEARLVELRARRFATEEEQHEEATLKKLKLAVKDEMERILRGIRE